MPRRAHCRDFPVVEPILSRILAGLYANLGENIVGVYLYGSLVDGGFDPGISDIDLAVALKSELEDAQFEALHGLHQALTTEAPEYRDRLELVYISTEALRSFRHKTSPIAVISPGEPFHQLQAGSDWLISWYALRQSGVALRGPAIASLIEPIPLADYLQGLRDQVRDYPALAAQTPSKSMLSYIALTMARALYTIRHGAATSKRDAACWARREFPQWSPLLEQAWRRRADADCDALTADQIRSEIVDYAHDMLSQIAD